jgi:hypothetical protein
VFEPLRQHFRPPQQGRQHRQAGRRQPSQWCGRAATNAPPPRWPPGPPPPLPAARSTGGRQQHASTAQTQPGAARAAGSRHRPARPAVAGCVVGLPRSPTVSVSVLARMVDASVSQIRANDVTNPL